MAIAAHSAFERDPFRNARDHFDATTAWLSGPDAPMDHTALEEGLDVRGRELLRLMYQTRLDQLSKAEREQNARSPAPDGVKVRARSRQIESKFGRMSLGRLGFMVASKPTYYPLDERLNLPADLYTHPLRRRMAEEARRGSWEQAIENVERTTAAHVPKRQAEQITVSAAQDFDAFYTSRESPANDILSATALLAMSCDSKGIRMRPESLREATRKEAEAAAATAVRGDPMAAKKLRKHDKRMAVVTAVWEQERQVRTAEDIVDNLRPPRERKRKRPKGPKPHAKRLSASVEKNQSTSIAAMFDDAQRRDLTNSRTKVVLVDGAEQQLELVREQARSRSMNVIIILDVIHVLHYLWLAARALCGKREAKAAVWVQSYLRKLLTRPAADVVAGIRQAATLRGLSAEERAPVEKCAEYLLSNSEYVRYRSFLEQGFPIATGIIEGACRHLIQDRLGITGARWNIAGAEAVLRLRAVHTNGDWDTYWEFHQEREAQRNYPRAA